MGSEQKIIEALKKLKEANAAAISRQTGFSTAYIDILCGSLIKSGELTKAAGRYSLAGAKKKAAPARLAALGLADSPCEAGRRAKRAVRPKKKIKKIKRVRKIKKAKKKKTKIQGWLPDWLK